MKKIILIFATASAVAFSSFAQETDKREKLTFGIKVGANLSNVYDSQGAEFTADPKLGLATGVFVGIPIGKYFGIQPEVLFSQKGFKAKGAVLGVDYNMTRTTSYIDVPIFVAIKPFDFLTILAGPQYSFLLSQNDELSTPLGVTDYRTEFKNENIRKNTFCFTGGADINISNLVLGARAGWDVLNNNGDGTSTTPRYKNMWYQATVGFRF